MELGIEALEMIVLLVFMEDQIFQKSIFIQGTLQWIQTEAKGLSFSDIYNSILNLREALKIDGFKSDLHQKSKVAIWPSG